MRTNLHHRRIAFFAVAALLFATTAFLAHGYGDGVKPHDNVKCELCLHFSGSAGAPSASTIVGKPILAIRQPVLLAQPVRPTRRNVDSRLPRGPPSNDLI
jgi:hypothetical protein